MALTVGISPLQLLIELAAMKQPIEDCWPECEDGFEATIRTRRRVRAGFPDIPATHPAPGLPPALGVSRAAAAILDKLVRKNYGLKPVRVSTLTKKWVHGASEDEVHELVKHGNLAWVDGAHEAVSLSPAHLSDTEKIVASYRLPRP